MTHYPRRGNWFQRNAEVILTVAAVLLVLLCCAGVGYTAFGGRDPARDRDLGVAGVWATDSVVTPAPSPKPDKSGGTRRSIEGNDIVHVGEDVPPGAYRTEVAVDDNTLFIGCVWHKSKDPEGNKIIAFDLVTGGRPQVTLKRGEWFKSTNCPTWRRR